MSSRRKKSKSKKDTIQLSEPMKQCQVILKQIQQKPDSAPFLEPVDWEQYGLTDYPEVITCPMDLGTVEKKLSEGKYSNPGAFATDVRLIWKNAMTYNRSDSGIFDIASKLAKQFEKKFQKVRKAGNKRRKAEPEVSRNDRINFSNQVHSLSDDQIGNLVVIIQKNCPDALNEEDEHELEIEINTIDGQTFTKIMDYVNQCIGTKRRKT